MPRYVMFDMLFHVKTIRSGSFMLGQIISCLAMLGEVRPGFVWLGEVRLG
jgi:hypothetical protein